MFPSSQQHSLISSPASQSPPHSPIEKATQVSFASTKLSTDDLEDYWTCLDCVDSSSEESWHTCQDCHELKRLFQFDGEQSLLDTRISLDELFESRLSARSRHRARSLSPSRGRPRSRSRTRLKSRSRSEDRGEMNSDNVEDEVESQKKTENDGNIEMAQQKSQTRSKTWDKDIMASFLSFKDKILNDRLQINSNIVPHDDNECTDREIACTDGTMKHRFTHTHFQRKSHTVDEPVRQLEAKEFNSGGAKTSEIKSLQILNDFPVSYFPTAPLKDTTSAMESISSGFGETPMSLEVEISQDKITKGREMKSPVFSLLDLSTKEELELETSRFLKQLPETALPKEESTSTKCLVEISFQNRSVSPQISKGRISVQKEKGSPVLGAEGGAELTKKVHFGREAEQSGAMAKDRDRAAAAARSTFDQLLSESSVDGSTSQSFEGGLKRPAVLELLQKSAEWLELRVVELNPGLAFLGSNLEEASTLQNAHQEVLTKLQGKQSPVEDLLNQADQLIATQRPKAEVYSSMAESLGLAWKDLNAHLETRKELLDLSVSFHKRAQEYAEALDEAEKIYTDNVMPSETDGVKHHLSVLQEKKRLVLEASMYTLQEANILLTRLRGLLQQGGSMDSRPYHIKTSIEFACSQIEHQLEALHDRRKFLDGLFATRKTHLEQCLVLCMLYQDLTEVVLSLKSLRDEISAHQNLGESQVSSEILLHEHLRREEIAKNLQDQCIRHVRTAEQMVATGHYAGTESRARSYSVLEAASALHDTCSTRTALLEQAALFFKLANTSLNKLDQAEIQVAGLSTGVSQRLSVVIGLVEEAVNPALTEGYAILEVTGGRGHSHNEGVTKMVEHLEKRRTYLSSLCEHTTEQALQKTELLNSFMDQYNSIDSWLVRIGDAFLQGHQDPGGSLSLAKDFYHLHRTLKGDISDKKHDIDGLEKFLEEIEKDLEEHEVHSFQKNIQELTDHWTRLTRTLEARILLCEIYLRFHEGAEKLQSKFENFEEVLRKAPAEQDHDLVETEWQSIQKSFNELTNIGKEFAAIAVKIDDQSLDVNRATICIKSILDNFGKKKLVISDLHSHFKMRISVNKELTALWKTYKENLRKMTIEMQNLEESFCPLLRGDSTDAEGMAISLEYRLTNFISAIKKIQEGIEAMVTKAEGHAYNEDASDERSETVRKLLQLYQNLQNKVTDYKILGTMLCQWCRNIAEIQKSCDKLEKQLYESYHDIRTAESQINENEATRQTELELIQFARNEASSIMTKIRNQCPPATGEQDIDTMEKMLERRRLELHNVWTEKQIKLETQLKRSQYQSDLQIISDQLNDLSDQLSNMKGRYGDSLPASIQMKAAFIQFKLTVDMLEKRIQSFVSTAEKMLGNDDDSEEIREELGELDNKWSTFHRQVGESQKNIDLSIEYFQLVQEAEDWFRQGSELLVEIAAESSQIHSPEDAIKLHQIIDNFLHPGEDMQYQRIKSISSLAIELYGDSPPEHVENVTKQNQHMIESFSAINNSISTLVDNLKQAEEEKARQEKEQQEMAASLVAAQADAEAARIAALAADDARKNAEEAARVMASTPQPIPVEKVEVNVQTEAIPLPSEEIVIEQQEYLKEEKYIDDKPEHFPPMFITPLVGAVVTEGVKFTFECRVIGYPAPSVEWLKDDLSIMTNPDYKTSNVEGVCSLVIAETITEDSALFTCRAGNASGTAQTSASLTVKETLLSETYCSPVFTNCLQDVSAKEGSQLELNCTVTGHPLPVVTWTKNGIVIDTSPDYVIMFNNGDCTLRFEELFLEDSAEYSCRAFNDHGEDVTQAKVSVTTAATSEKPVFTVPLSNIMARAGQKFKLECHVKGTPPPTMAWFHNGKPVKETPDCKISFDGSTATLLMAEAFPKNAGVYSAVAKNTAGDTQSSSNVSVKGRIPTETSDSEMTSDADAEPIKPTMQLKLKDTVIKEGDTVRLDCVIVGHPEPEVIWYHNGKPVKESEDFKLLFHGDRCSLVIQEAFVEDGGEYKVVAMNSAGEASTACNLTVKEVPVVTPVVIAPHFLMLLSDCHVCENNPILLKAKVEGSPFPNISWFKDSIPLLPDNDLQINQENDGSATVEIPSTSVDHTGQYEIVATNSAGSAKCIAFLSVEQYLPPKPADTAEPPMFINLLEDTEAYSGDSMTFEVEVSGKPKPVISWAINDYRLTGTEYQNGERQYFIQETTEGVHCLRIPSISMVQSGTVGVTAENVAGKATSACRLKVQDKPSLSSNEDEFNKRIFISESSSTRVITSSSTVDGQPSSQSFTTEQKSQISSGTDQPVKEIHETKVQKVSQEADEPPVVVEKVIIRKFEDKQAVEEIKEEFDSTPSTPTRKSTRKPAAARFITPLQGVIAQEKDRIVLEGVIDGFPQPTVEWKHNGGPLPEDAVPSIDINKVSILLPEVLQSHSGRYTCLLDNPSGSAQCTCDIVVKKTQFPPVFSRRLQPAVVGVGSRLHLEVDVSGTPSPSVQWSKNGEAVRQNQNLLVKSEGTRHWLTISIAEEADSGRYGVTATNAAGKAESLADVIISELASDGLSSQRIVYTEVQDDIRNEPLIEEGHVGKLRKDYLEELDLVVTTKDTNQASLSPDEDTTITSELPKVPGKLKAEWPPPPCEEDIPLPKRIDASLEISKDKVSSAVCIFRELEDEPSEAIIPNHAPVVTIKSNSERPLSINLEDGVTDNLVPGPKPEYGFISTDTILFSEPHISTPIKDNFDKEYKLEESQIPDDAIIQTPVSAKLYGQINKVSAISNIDEMPKLIEVKTEKEVTETNVTEVKTTVSSSEKTVLETKVFREYDDHLICETHPDQMADQFVESQNIESGKLRKDKKKRESVKQIAIRLEESIAPLSAEDVPRGIRTFPSPSIQTPTKSSEPVIEDGKEDQLFNVPFSRFPNLSPFPFEVERVSQQQRPKIPPPPTPNKFIAGRFSEKDSYSDSEVPTGEKLQLRKIKFEPPLKPTRKQPPKETSPPPPSSFDNPPNSKGMRPIILKDRVLKEEKAEITVKKPSQPKTPPKIVQKFLSKTVKEETPKQHMEYTPSKTEVKNRIVETVQKTVVPIQKQSVDEPCITSSLKNEIHEERSVFPTCDVSSKKEIVSQSQYTKVSNTSEANTYLLSNNTKSPASTKSNRMSWPPTKEEDDHMLECYWAEKHNGMEIISPDGNKATESVTYPPVYWSSNVSLSEKRPELYSIGTTQEQGIHHKEHSSSLETKRDVVTSSSNKFVNPMSTPKLLKQSSKTTSITAKHTTKLPDTPAKKIEINFGEKKLQPFPFEVPRSDQMPRKTIPPPARPKKFIPGAFAESDYESDYEDKPLSVWRPYASDSETSEYRPMRVKLKQGRARTPRNISPPAPSQFDIPSHVSTMLKASADLKDSHEKEMASKTIESAQHQLQVCHNISNLPEKQLPAQPRMARNVPQSGVGKLQQKFEHGDIIRSYDRPITEKETFPSRQYQTLPRSAKFHSQSKMSSHVESTSVPHPVLSPEAARVVPVASRDEVYLLPVKMEDECGYAADTESTLPRRVKTQSESTTFSKNESFTSSSTFKSVQSAHTTKIVSDAGSMSQDIMEKPYQSSSFPSPLNNSMQSSSAFASSESKTSKVKNVWYGTR